MRLPEPATVKVVVTRKVKGHRVGGVCRPEATTGPKCTVAVRKATLSFSGRKGGTSFRFKPTKLRAGPYVAKIAAKDAARNVSKPVSLRFTVKRPA
jgi:hypothetical protein